VTANDLIFMDCHMPEMNGYSATKWIRKAEQEKQNHSEALQAQVPENSSSTLHPTERPPHRLPIIAMTANTMKEDREFSLEAGMDDFLAKPVLLNDVENMINACLPNCSTSN
jgi:two-component system, sensor histidine kinase and response regulator